MAQLSLRERTLGPRGPVSDLMAPHSLLIVDAAMWRGLRDSGFPSFTLLSLASTGPVFQPMTQL